MGKKLNFILLSGLLFLSALNLSKASALSKDTEAVPVMATVETPAYTLSSPKSELPDKSAYDNTQREMRGIWIATVKNTNMPAKMDKEAFTKWAAEICAFLKSENYNTIIFQVRPTGDALYKSQLNPWSSFITGSAQGTDPGYDPLEIMVSEAHKNGLELHAWINPFRITMPSDQIKNLSPENIAAKNPGWLIKHGTQYYLDPGIPEVRTHLVNTVKEIVLNYDIDAVHIDDYFYPYPIQNQVYDDSKSFASYGAGYNNIDDWRRDNVTQLIRELKKSIQETKSWVQFGISPFGVWRNAKTDPTGSQTNAGHECYDSLYADTRKWINEGIIDYITPQIYWSTEFKAANYKVLADWWQKEAVSEAKTTPVNLYIGLADYKVNNNTDEKWLDVNEISNQIALNRSIAPISGQMHYSFNSVKENQLNYRNVVKESKYQNIAITPSVYWNDYTLPAVPSSFTAVKAEKNGIKLTVSSADTAVRKYAIYRFEGNKAGEYSDKNLIAVVYKTINSTEYTDTSAISGKIYTYAVKSLSHTGIINNTAKISMPVKY